MAPLQNRRLFSTAPAIFVTAFITLVTAFGSTIATAETRRAFLVGINAYEPPPATFNGREAGAQPSRRAWKNLLGAVNDVRAMREILIRRFGFDEQNIVVLENAAATREAIVSTFHRQLIEPVQPGDTSVFFYAGHGSRIRNSNSTELDKKDETIVPVDANVLSNGTLIADIRDKEWDRLFTQVLDKGGLLTAIFDSCHSGSISRGPAPDGAESRFAEEDDRDVATLIGPEPPAHAPGREPDKRPGALIVSAAQEDQQAKETVHVVGTTREWHGAFTLALIGTLNDLPTNSSATRVFEQVTARLKADGHRQDPVLAGLRDRTGEAIFGGVPEVSHAPLRVNLIQAYAQNDLELQGGIALGLTPGTELRQVRTGPPGPPVRLRISEVRNVVRSRAEILDGNWKRLKPGDEFEVVRWGADPDAALRLWIPPVISGEQDSVRLAADIAKQSQPDHVVLVDDPTASIVTHILHWDGSQWQLSFPTGKSTKLGRMPTADQVLDQLKSERQPTYLYINVSPTKALVQGLRIGDLSATQSARLVRSPDEAHYVLTGRVVGQDVHYAWVSRSFTGSDHVSSNSAPLPLPDRTSWGTNATLKERCQDGGLNDCLTRLVRLHHWLTVKSAPDPGRFPYELALKRQKGDGLLEKGPIEEGLYRLVLKADPARIEAVQKRSGLQSRYVYVFVIDREGQTTLLFPNNASKDKENLVPSESHLTKPGSDIAELGLGESAIIEIRPPFGTDTFVMMTSVQPIPRIKELVESEQVREHEHTTRGSSDWSIQRFFLRSIQKQSP
ncbi:MAG: caspase family protein [Nitrospiraceae bacterium]